MDLRNGEEENKPAVKEKSTTLCRLESLETDSYSYRKIAQAFRIRSLPLSVL